MSKEQLFKVIKSAHIKSLNATYKHYRHKTGAEHYHIAADNPENVFMVAFRTVPEDSMGCAHILEHTALCGSEKYPVRDPFFMMLRRSLNTFMNAFTSSDWTAYPFASQNHKDFNNLLGIYLDAAFFPRLHELDFAQEGHRLEFSEPDNAKSDLMIKGVVYNEMKGAMSSPTSTLWQTLCQHLFPSTTYRFNSGGEPEDIPNLTYEQLKAFHKKFYHPSNAIFLTYGDIPAAQLQQEFQEQVLSRFTKDEVQIAVPDEQRFSKALKVEEKYAIQNEESAQKTHIILGWLLGHSFDNYESLKMQLLSQVLLDNSASPLRKALEKTTLASAPSALCGLEDAQREMTFVCGVEGSEATHADKIEKEILTVLKEVAREGIPKEDVEAILQQIELHQREISGDGYPYGLQLILRMLPVAVHRGDPLQALDIEQALERLHNDIEKPDFIKSLVKEHLLDNPHCVRLVLKPDTKLSEQKETKLREKLAKKQQTLKQQEKQQIIEQASALKERQQGEEDTSCLPILSIEDIPNEVTFAKGGTIEKLSTRGTYYPQGTNGLVYQHIIMPLPALQKEELVDLTHMTQFLTEVGCADKDYLETQKWQAQACGDIHATTDIRTDLGDILTAQGYFILSGKTLLNKHKSLCDLQSKTLTTASFKEHDRIKELLSQQSTYLQESITHNGHRLAMMAASSSLTPLAKLNHDLHGLAFIQRVKKLNDEVQEKPLMLRQLCSRLESLYQKFQGLPRELLVIGEQENEQTLCQQLIDGWPARQSGAFRHFRINELDSAKQQMWITNTQVNFCAAAYKTVPIGHPDAPALSVLAAFLRNGYLHRVIREEGGAYGGGALHDTGLGIFRFFSYRDPRAQETFQAFEDSLQWLRQQGRNEGQLEEGIISVIGQLDKPLSPAGEASRAFYLKLFGREPELINEFRQRVLKVTISDLIKVSGIYFKPDQASKAIVTNENFLDKQGNLNMVVSQI